MLTILGAPLRYCDGISRRSFLKIGGLSMGAVGGMNLSTLLRAEDASGVTNGHKSVINIFLGGGPPHQDMWEIKTEAPSEIRGPFVPIATNVPGVQIGECFPKIAAMMDKFIAIRSVVGCKAGHDSFQCFSGWDRGSLASMGGRPSIGSVLSKLKGPVDRGVPPTVALSAPTQHGPWSYPGGPGFLGSAYSAFRPDGEGLANLSLNGVTLDRLEDRKLLLSSLDGLKREVDANGTLDGIDAFNEAAFGVLTSSKLLKALDLNNEPAETRARYGDGKPYQFQYDGAPTVNEHILMARRLVEAGVRSVTLSYGRWDSHGDNFGLVRDHGSKLDQAVSALVQDLDERNMLDDVTVVVWGEFGRTPRINQSSGRDHWPQVSCALMAGGGMKTGQAIGATNRLGEYAVERPVDMQEVVATIYHNMGIDPSVTRLMDPAGRPQQLVDFNDPIREVV
ncbi:MAG: DUF1501 domain-containing protein [Planctomycetota bacterium]|nr:DUF1501 domain-containing protein [Planctomycetota bacterium]MDA1212417.1 DUF1501 domain-containing protein [Planctomycetota bacterium]